MTNLQPMKNSIEMADFLKINGIEIDVETDQALAFSNLKQLSDLYQLLEDRLPMPQRSNTKIARAAAHLFREIITDVLAKSVSKTVLTPQWYDEQEQCFYEIIEEELTPPEPGWCPVTHVAGEPIMDLINDELRDAFHLADQIDPLSWLEQAGVKAGEFLQQYQLIDNRSKIIVTSCETEDGETYREEEEPYQCPNFVTVENLISGAAIAFD